MSTPVEKLSSLISAPVKIDKQIEKSLKGIDGGLPDP
jgi:hypothetical protein